MTELPRPRAVRRRLMRWRLAGRGARTLLAGGLALAAAIATAPAADAEGAKQVVAPTSRACLHFGARAECGHVRRPWDPTGAVPGKLGIGYVFYPARNDSHPALGTIVAQEGGPGYAATASRSYYRGLYAPLLERRNLLLVDQRGTGRSAAIDCPELQDLRGPYAPAAAQCAARLGNHAHLFGTDLAADDLAAVIEALGVGPVDLYGDSYGTFFAQVFAGRHGDLLRTLTLDAAYPAYGEDAWYDTQAPALRRSLSTVCTESAWCAERGGAALDRLDDVIAVLRAHPVSGTAPGADGELHRVTLDPPTLAYVAYNGTYVPTTYRELDSAIAAALESDWTPLLRLVAEVDFPGGGASRARSYSEGLDAAVTCRDYPQVFDLMAPPAQRRAQLEAAIEAKESADPSVYAPFTVREQVASGWTTLDWCTDWPAPPPDYAPGPLTPPSGAYPAVPTLVLTGELDTITTPAEGDIVTGQFPNATHVVVAAGLHVTALGDLDDCASGIARSFITTAEVGDTSCAADVPPLRTAPPFWRTTRDAPPATPVGARAEHSASDSARTRLQTVTVTVAAVGDALARWGQTYDSGGLGLRGGHWHGSGGDSVAYRLKRCQVTDDLTVSGHLVWDQVGGTVRGQLRPAPAVPVGARAGAVNAPAGGHLTISWDTRSPGAIATIEGRLDGRPVTATVLAP